MSPIRPPPWLAARLLRLILHPDDREHAIGDLEEEYAVLQQRDERAARRWYWQQARRALGPSLRRRLRRWSVADLAHETRFALRALRRRPGFAGVCVGTLGLGIGAATAIFSVADAVLLEPLPYPAPSRLVTVWNTYDSWRGHEVLDAYWDRVELSYPEYLDWRAGQSSFEEIAIYATTSMALTGRGDPTQVTAGIASTSLLPMLGAHPPLGRTFVEGEEGPGAPRIAVLSYELWRDRFGGDATALGGTVTLDGNPFEVVGVLPAGFRLRALGFAAPRDFRHDVWLPIGSTGNDLDRGNHRYEAIGRLVEGTGIEAAHAEVAPLLAGDAAPGSRGARLAYRKDEEVGSAREPLLLLLGAVGLLLLIACGNVAALMLSEAASRYQELGTKVALGAGLGRIVRQLTIESVLLGLAGALVGLATAYLGSGILIRLAPADLPLPEAVTVDVRVLVFALVIGTIAGVAFGVMPTAGIRRASLQRIVRGTGGHAKDHGRRVQRTVVALQVAVSLVLVVSGTLLGRSLLRLESVRPGFDASDLLTARISLPRGRYGRDQAAGFFHELDAALQRRAGVEATAVSAMPFSGRGGSSSFQIVGREVPESKKQPEAHRRTVLADYHEVLRIPLLAGRYLRDSDRTFERPVTVVSASMASRYWPDGSALGARIFRDRREFEVVGVVADVLHGNLAEPPLPTFYVPLDVAENGNDLTVVLRHDVTVGAASELVRESVWTMDPALPVDDIAEVTVMLSDSTRPQRFRTLLLIAFAAAATALSAIGLFGVTARVVATRASELGIRLALGARSGGLVGHMTARELPALLLGVGLGVVGSLAASGLLARFLFGVAPTDPVALSSAVALLLLVGITAILAAARRTLRLDPVDAIRAD